MKKILIVDDEPDILKMLAFEAENHEDLEIDFAKDGEEALDLLLKNKYHGLITDLKMPKMDGRELLEKIKENSIELDAIFVVSGNPREFHMEELEALGVISYIQKPYRPSEVLDIITSHLD